MTKKNEKTNGEFKIPKVVSKFANKTWKKYWKENKDVFDSKKDGLKEFCLYLQDNLPEVIEFIVRYGHINNDEVKQVKNDCFKKIINDDFVKYLAKRVKKDDDFAKSIRLFPIIVREIGSAAEEENKRAISQNPNSAVYDMTDLYDVSKKLMKKQMKNMMDIGVSEDMAFDILSLIPYPKAMAYSPVYRIRNLFNTLYEWAKCKTVPFAEIVNVLVKEEQFTNFIVFALLEKREVYSNMTEGQKNLYTDITTWCINTMEKMSNDEITSIINAYTKARNRDEHNGKDTARRYNLSVLGEEDYPHISAVIKRLIADNSDIQKYL